MTNQDRREILLLGSTLAFTAAAGLSMPARAAEAGNLGSALGYQHVPVPLPFDAKGLKGLSEKLIQSVQGLVGVR